MGQRLVNHRPAWPDRFGQSYSWPPGVGKSMRVSRAIADLAGDEKAGRAALAEALDYLAMPLLALVWCLRSIASHVSAAISMPDKRWISRMPVGEVTLISGI